MKNIIEISITEYETVAGKDISEEAFKFGASDARKNVYSTASADWEAIGGVIGEQETE